MSYPTPAPYPGPAPHPAPVASGSLIPPSPLQLGQVFSSAFILMKQRLGLFLGLSALSAAVLFVLPLMGIGALLALVASASFGAGTRNAPVGALVGGGLLALVLVVAAYLIQIKITAMMIALARDTGEGRRPSMGELAAETKGVVVRSLGVLAIMAACVVVMYGLIIGIVVAIVAAATAGGSRSSSSTMAGGLGVLMMLLFLAIGIGAFIVGVRITYWQQSLALEGTSGLAPLKRSWALTQGDFWRTVGWLVCLGLIATAASWVMQMLTSVLTMPLQASLTAQMDQADDPAAVAAVMAALIPVFAITFLGSTLIQLLYAPFASCFMTVMFGDAVQRRAMKDAGIDPAQVTGYGYAGVPAGGYYPQVGQQPYGQPGPYEQPYGQPAYDPNAGYGQPVPDASGQYPHQQAYEPRPYGAPDPASAQPSGASPWTPPSSTPAGPYASGPVGQQAFGDAPYGDQAGTSRPAGPSAESNHEGTSPDDRS